MNRRAVNTLNIREVFLYRNDWMAIAIIWVMLFHLGEINIPGVKQLFALGYGGVDIFFYASGIGCWYSLHKNPNELEFLGRRAKRILPAYIPAIIIYFIIIIVGGGKLHFQEILGNLFYVGVLLKLENQFNWYLCGLWLFYLISPVLVQFVDRYYSNIKKLVGCFILLLLFTLCFLNHVDAMMLTTRFLIGYLGIISAKIGSEKDAVPKAFSVVLILTMLAGFCMIFLAFKLFPDVLGKYGLYWYPFILITPGLCYLISYISARLSVINSILGYIGKHSFELYLTHLILFSIVNVLKNKLEFIMQNTVQCKIVAMLISFPVAFLYKKMLDSIFVKKLLDK